MKLKSNESDVWFGGVRQNLECLSTGEFTVSLVEENGRCSMKESPKMNTGNLPMNLSPKVIVQKSGIRLAKEAGMKYMVLTIRHHDGFSLFDSKVSDFTAPRTRCGRDIVREYVDARTKYDILAGIYREKTTLPKKYGPKVFAKAVMIRTHKFKYIYCPDDINELYNLEDDPQELHNLTGKPEVKEIEQDLKERLLKWFIQTVDTVPHKWDKRGF